MNKMEEIELEKLIDYISDLAYLKLEDKEKEELKIQLKRIISYVSKIKELDLSGVEPLSYVIEEFGTQPLRQDKPSSFKEREKILQQAPEYKGNYFVVPKVI